MKNIEYVWQVDVSIVKVIYITRRKKEEKEIKKVRIYILVVTI